MQGRHWVVLKIALSAGLIYWILHGADLRTIWHTMANADRTILAVAFMSYFIGYYITASRWGWLLRAQGIIAPILYLCKSFMVAMFFNNFLPSTVGGDAVRMFDSWRLGNSKTDAVTVIFVDRFIGLLSLLTFASIGVLLTPQVSSLVPGLWIWVVLACCGAFFAAFLIFYPPPRFIEVLASKRVTIPNKVKGLADRITNAVSLFRGRHDVLIPALTLSFILQANVVFHYFLVAMALGLNIPLMAFFAIVPLAILLMMVPISINGIGVRESVFTFFLAAYGVGQSHAVAFAWLIYGMILLQGVLGGLVFAFRRSARQKDVEVDSVRP